MEDYVQLVESSTVTLHNLLLKVREFHQENVETISQEVNEFVEKLREIDEMRFVCDESTVPVGVLQLLDQEENNPELYLERKKKELEEVDRRRQEQHEAFTKISSSKGEAKSSK